MLSFKFQSSYLNPLISPDIGGKLVQDTLKFGIFTVHFRSLVIKMSGYSGNFWKCYFLINFRGMDYELLTRIYNLLLIMFYRNFVAFALIRKPLTHLTHASACKTSGYVSSFSNRLCHWMMAKVDWNHVWVPLFLTLREREIPKEGAG